MKRAAAFFDAMPARSAEGHPSMRFVAAVFPEDIAFASESFSDVRLLGRSAADVGRFHVPRKLPILRDVLAIGRSIAEDADYLIFSNSDICVSPVFYSVLSLLIRSGVEAMTVNRRTLPEYPAIPDHLPLMSASIGASHPGFDCFVFPAPWVDRFVPTLSLVGIQGVGRWLLYNMVGEAERLLLLNAVCLTFHLGDEQAWSDPLLNDYREFNFRELRATYSRMAAVKKTRVEAFCHAYREPVYFAPMT